MKYSLPRTALLGVLGATTALAAVTLARADDCCATTAASSAATTTSASTASAGMMAARDPVTGALRAPTPEEIAALRPAAKLEGTKGKEKAEPVVRQLPNGVLAITADPSLDVYSVAVKGPDGKVRTACVPGDKVEAVMEAAQKANVTKKEVLDEK